MLEYLPFRLAAFNDPDCGKPICAGESGIPKSTSNIEQALGNFAELGLTLLGLFAVITIIWAGVQFASSGGNPQKTKQAREAIIYALIGIAFAVGAYGIVQLITTRIG